MHQWATNIGDLETQGAGSLKRRQSRKDGHLAHETSSVGTDLSREESDALLDLFALLDKWDQERGLDGN
jgi:hypothetical protein